MKKKTSIVNRLTLTID